MTSWFHGYCIPVCSELLSMGQIFCEVMPQKAWTRATGKDVKPDKRVPPSLEAGVNLAAHIA